MRGRNWSAAGSVWSAQCGHLEKLKTHLGHQGALHLGHRGALCLGRGVVIGLQPAHLERDNRHLGNQQRSASRCIGLLLWVTSSAQGSSGSPRESSKGVFWVDSAEFYGSGIQQALRLGHQGIQQVLRLGHRGAFCLGIQQALGHQGIQQALRLGALGHRGALFPGI